MYDVPLWSQTDMQHLLSGGVEVHVRGPVDLESPAPDSCPTATWTQIQVPIVRQENGQLVAEFEWSLPLHSRYPVSFSPSGTLPSFMLESSDLF